MNATLNEAARQFQIEIDGLTALLAYYRKQDKIAFVHTEVPPELGGTGLGAALAKSALDYARDQSLRVFPFCTFVRAYMKKHPEWDDLKEDLEDW